MSLAQRAKWILELWFSASAPVDRAAYAWTGFCLLALKYAMDASFVWFVTGELWDPLEYLIPRSLEDCKVFSNEHRTAALSLIALGLPFLWIGVSMTIRRAGDAGFSVWSGMLFFLPVVNYIWMLALCGLPTAPSLQTPQMADRPRVRAIILRAALPAALLGLSCLLFGIFALGSYGAGLFVGVPFVLGFTAAYRARRLGGGKGHAYAATGLSVSIVAGLLILLAFEGAICILMAAPLMLVLAMLAATIAGGLAARPAATASQILLLFAILPGLMGAERIASTLPLREVTTSLAIAAPPLRVWSHVIGFTELPQPERWVFALGIAYPQRAHIEGSGVGAVRYCEFSTGPFVEPITVWDPPRRLAFDVAAQPEPMQEWSPYQVVHAPHLLHGMQSKRGEFRLVALSNGSVRLEGSTWYTLDMAPAFYWTWMSDALLHEIHGRVLEHVKRLAEVDAASVYLPASS